MPQTAQPRLTVAAAYSQAIDNFNAARYTEADKLCTAITQAVPNHIDAINLLGIIAQKLNRHDLAVEQFQRAIEIDSNRALLYFNLGTSLYPLGRREEAIKSLRIALKKEPGNSQIADYLNVVLQTGVNSAQHNAEETLQRGISFHQSGQMEEAIRWYRKTLAIQPEDPAALSNIGSALHSTGKLDEAAACYQKAIAIKPDFAEAYSNLGNTFKEQGKLDEAVTNYQKAISIKPDYTEAHSNLGNALQEQGKLDEAVTSCQKAISINPDYAEAYSNLGNALQRQKKLDEAVASYQKAISIKPDYAAAHSNLGSYYEKINKVELAEEHIKKSIKIFPDNPLAKCLLSSLLRRKGKIDEALQLLTPFSTMVIQDKEVASNIHFELGRLYDRKKDSIKAFHNFEIGNRWQSHGYAPRLKNKQKFLSEVEQSRQTLTPVWLKHWSTVKNSQNFETPLFLVGFPRSGTTLLDQILDSHPQLQVMEEKPALLKARQSLCGVYPSSLATLKEVDIQCLRDIYFQEVNQHISRAPNTMLVDKFPLYIRHIPLIMRIFPNAKIILAMRHPCDVVLRACEKIPSNPLYSGYYAV